jgi:hypothetical protein
MTEAAIEDRQISTKKVLHGLYFLVIIFTMGAWIGSLFTAHHLTRSTGDADVRSLKLEAFSPVDQAATFGDIANKCMALTEDSQRRAKTDAEKVRLAEQGTTCLSFVTGFLDGYYARQRAVFDKKLEFCIPPEVNTAQILRTFLTVANAHPEASQTDGAAALQAVLVNAYPCKDADALPTTELHSIVSP